MSLTWRVVSRSELLSSGWSPLQINEAIRGGALQPMRRGVYLDGPRLDGADGWRQDVAILARLHGQAVVAGQSAAALLGLDGFEPPVPILLHAPRGSASASPLIRRRDLLAPPIAIEGLPVISVEEVLLGLAETVTPRPGCAAASRRLCSSELVELALEDALRRGLTSLERLGQLVATTTDRRPGRSVLRTVLRRRPVDAAPTGSYLETRCHQVLRAAGIADFHRQVSLFDRLGRIGIVDFARDGVVIEVVGRQWHLDRFAPDHRRYARLTAAGQRLLTFTFDDVEGRPGHVVDATRAALDAVLSRTDGRTGNSSAAP